MAGTRIEWSKKVWNPVTGCDKLTVGCKNCYGVDQAEWLHGIGQNKYKNKFKLTLHPEYMDEPYGWKAQTVIFVNSMSDLFHEKIPDKFIKDVFKVMNNTHHIYQVLTKRSERMMKLGKELNWTDNIWAGITIEHKDLLYRLDHLLKCGTKHTFLSLEPLLSDLNDLDLKGVDWVVIGGESSKRKNVAREMKPEWVRGIRDKCIEAKVPLFFKQWYGTKREIIEKGNKLDGEVYLEYPPEMLEVINIILARKRKPKQNRKEGRKMIKVTIAQYPKHLSEDEGKVYAGILKQYGEVAAKAYAEGIKEEAKKPKAKTYTLQHAKRLAAKYVKGLKLVEDHKDRMGAAIRYLVDQKQLKAVTAEIEKNVELFKAQKGNEKGIMREGAYVNIRNTGYKDNVPFLQIDAIAKLLNGEKTKPPETPVKLKGKKAKKS